MYGMIDIETLSTRNDACVIAIGMIGFDDKEILYSEGFQIHEKDWHGHIDPLTVKWWMGQDFSFRNPDAIRVDAAAERFKKFAQDYCQKECWANSPQFDLTILRSWWDRIDRAHGSWPIPFRNLRDTRTLWSLAGDMGIDMSAAWQNAGVAHNPIDDAARQARAVILARNAIKQTHHDVR
jgi:hypothetical protein